MTRALKIENLTEIDETASDVLRVISKEIGAKESDFVDYALIAKSLNIDRKVVSSAVNRMVNNKILKIENGKLSILNSVVLS